MMGSTLLNVPIEESVGAMTRLVEQGKTRFISLVARLGERNHPGL